MAGGQGGQQGGGETLAQYLERIALGPMNQVIANGMDAARLIRATAQAVYRNEDLARCTRASIAAAVIEAAEVGLEIGSSTLALAYLVPYKHWLDDDKFEWRAQFQASWKGKAELARRSGFVRNIDAVEIHERDQIEFFKGTDPKILHKIPMGDRGDVVAYYAVAFFVDGGFQFTEPRTVKWINAHRQQFSKMPNGKAWKDSFDAMARKTMMHQIEAMLPLSPEQLRAHDTDADIPTTFQVDAKTTGEEVVEETVEPAPAPAPAAKKPSRALAAAQERSIELPNLPANQQRETVPAAPAAPPPSPREKSVEPHPAAGGGQGGAAGEGETGDPPKHPSTAPAETVRDTKPDTETAAGRPAEVRPPAPPPAAPEPVKPQSAPKSKGKPKDEKPLTLALGPCPVERQKGERCTLVENHQGPHEWPPVDTKKAASEPREPGEEG